MATSCGPILAACRQNLPLTHLRCLSTLEMRAKVRATLDDSSLARVSCVGLSLWDALRDLKSFSRFDTSAFYSLFNLEASWISLPLITALWAPQREFRRMSLCH